MSAIVLPWPVRELSPNARPHWGAKARAAKKAKATAHLLAKEAGWHRKEWPEGPLFVWIEAYRPSRRPMDVDNLLASLKSALDGIAEAIGIDDSRFQPRPHIYGETRPGGEVRILITGPA